MDDGALKNRLKAIEDELYHGSDIYEHKDTIIMAE